jgi:hypothetical protein
MPDSNSINVDKVDVHSRNVRGIRGSVFAVATQAELDSYVGQLDAAIPEDLAYDNLAETIARRVASVTGPFKDPDPV